MQIFVPPQAPQDPPQPFGPHTLPAQFGTQHAPAAVQTAPDTHWLADVHVVKQSVAPLHR